MREDRPRRCTQWATTNDDAYLASQTGNRRFWPLPVGRIDIEALRRDRDQLWGEAATLEAKGASIVLDPALWPAAAEEQEKRRIRDTWEDVIENMPPAVEVREGFERSPNHLPVRRQGDGSQRRCAGPCLGRANRTPTPRAQDPSSLSPARALTLPTETLAVVARTPESG